MTDLELIEKCFEVINDHCECPSDELIKIGSALIEIGKTLKGKSPTEARAILLAVSCLENVRTK